MVEDVTRWADIPPELRAPVPEYVIGTPYERWFTPNGEDHCTAAVEHGDLWVPCGGTAYGDDLCRIHVEGLPKLLHGPPAPEVLHTYARKPARTGHHCDAPTRQGRRCGAWVPGEAEGPCWRHDEIGITKRAEQMIRSRNKSTIAGFALTLALVVEAIADFTDA